MRVLWAVFWKDLVTEWRSRERVVAMLLFALLVVLMFHFALPKGSTEEPGADPAGLLWIAYLFAALLGLNRSFAQELENQALSGLALAPANRGWIFLGKAAASFVFLALVQLATAVAFAATFDVALAPVALPLAGVAALGAVGLCSVGTLFSAMAVRTRNGDVMLPLLLLPLFIPVLLGAVRASANLLIEGHTTFGPVQLLLVTDGIFLIVSFLTFDYVLDE